MRIKPCPHCNGTGRIEDRAPEATDLVSRMDGGRYDVYRAGNRRFYLTYGNGEVNQSAITQALDLGLIRPKWDASCEYWQVATAPDVLRFSDDEAKKQKRREYARNWQARKRQEDRGRA